MNTFVSPPERLPVAHSAVIQVAIIYEEFLSGARAKLFAERLADRLGFSCQLSESVWRSDMLASPSIAGQAAAAAANCDYLIISLRGDSVLPRSTRRWIEALLDSAAGHLPSVIALLGSEDGEAELIDGNRNYLREVCAAHGVEFFSHAGMPPAENPVTLEFAQRRLPGPLDE